MSETKQEQTIPNNVTNEIEELMRRLKLLEERFSNLRKKSSFDEQTMLKDTKEIFEELNNLENNLTDIKTEISDLNEKLVKLTEEIKQTVKKHEFNVLLKYIEFWQPMNFLTKEDAEKIISSLDNFK